MRKALFINQLVSNSTNEGRYSKLNTVKFLYHGPLRQLGIMGCKQIVDEVVGPPREGLLTKKEIEDIYKKAKPFMKKFNQGIHETIVTTHLYECSMCASRTFGGQRIEGVGSGEVSKTYCEKDCVGKIIGEVIVKTTINRFKDGNGEK